MAKRRLTTGEKGWIGLVAYIVAVDSVAWWMQAKHEKHDETMSVAWGRWLQHPGSRVATGSAWALITGHLFLSIPLPGGKTLKTAVQKRASKQCVNAERLNVAVAAREYVTVNGRRKNR